MSLLNVNENKFYLKASIVAIILWILSKSPVRGFLQSDNNFIDIIIGSLPNFFAGSAYFFIFKYLFTSKNNQAFIYSIFILIASEFAQIILNKLTFDWFDIIGSFIGISLAVAIDFKRFR